MNLLEIVPLEIKIKGEGSNFTESACFSKTYAQAVGITV